jgi:PAS domain S-box-containing protein
MAPTTSRRLARRVIKLSPWARYVIGVGLAAVAILTRLAFDPVWGVRFPYITMFPAIMLSAWLGGLWPGILTTAIAGTAAEYFWIGPSRSWAVQDLSELLGIVTFVFVGVVISALNEAWRRGTDALAESEERLGVTLTSIGDAVITTDAEGHITHLNPIASALTGWTMADALERPLRDVFIIINEETGEPAENPVYRVLRDGLVAGLANHTLLVSKDGREIPIDDSAAPIRTADGTLTGVVMVFRDITERRRADLERTTLLERERAAHAETDRARRDAEASAQQLQNALQAGRMGTWQFTISTGEVKWSPGLEAIHGYAPGRFAGTFDAFQSEIHPQDRDRVIEAIRGAAEQHRDHHVEYRIVRPDGVVRWVEGMGQVLYDERGQPDRMIGVCTDVTERIRAEEERQALFLREQAARAEIERADRLKDEFLAALSHELRTPLNAVLGYVHLLRSGAVTPERAAHALQVIERNAQLQARLVESLLDLSRILAGKLDLELRQVDLARVVEAAVDVIRPDADASGVTVSLEPPATPIAIVADSARLQQVLWNLLANAVKFTPGNGRVSVRWTAESGDQVRVAVSDTGRGIEAQFLPRVFDRFSQAENARSHGGGGLGLGLALVREMVHAHGGTVVAESPGEGRGSTFIVTLPIYAGSAKAGVRQTASV